MIIYFNNGTKGFKLNEYEVQEIKAIYLMGGRYVSFSSMTHGSIEVYDEDETHKPNKVIAELCGNIVKVLHKLCDNIYTGFVEILEIMQKYPNEYKVYLSEEEKDILCDIYNKGGRFIKRALGRDTLFIYNENKERIFTMADDIYYTLFNIEQKTGSKHIIESSMFDLTSLIKCYCN